ncbi:MAG: hypothetical protein RLZZ500_2665 [Bacteroidota bacterium]
MITAIISKLPMRNRQTTLDFYTRYLGFKEWGNSVYPHYLIVERDGHEIHFFLHESLEPKENYGQLYFRTAQVDALYEEFKSRNTPIHPFGALESKAWGQREFSVLDPDHNLLTFGTTL